MTDSPLKAVGYFCLCIVFLAVIATLIALLMHGMVWASEVALPWLIGASRIAFDVCVLVLLPLWIFRRTRPWAGLGFYISSYIFGTMLFAFSCIVVVQFWGYVGLIFGLLMGGVGVVPLAFFAALFHGAWPIFWTVVLGLVLTYVTRVAGPYLSKPRYVEQEELTV